MTSTMSSTARTGPFARTAQDRVVRKSTAQATVTAEPTCACGQALEWLHTSHCPRCGIHVDPRFRDEPDSS